VLQAARLVAFFTITISRHVDQEGAARGHVAEVRIEPVERANCGKPNIDRTAFAFVDYVDSRFHVVVDAATRYSAKRIKRAGVGIEQHLVALDGIRSQPNARLARNFMWETWIRRNSPPVSRPSSLQPN